MGKLWLKTAPKNYTRLDERLFVFFKMLHRHPGLSVCLLHWEDKIMCRRKKDFAENLNYQKIAIFKSSL